MPRTLVSTAPAMIAAGLSLVVATTLLIGQTQPVFAAGADVVYSGLPSVSSYGPVGAIRAYSLGTGTCNIGTADHEWNSNGSPGVGFNAYRLHDGRLMQIGMSWVKTACCVANSSGCSMTCASSGTGLRVGCRDTYSSGWNASQTRMMPRSQINPSTGAYGTIPGGTFTAIDRRLQIAESDLSATNFPGALYFVEGEYVGTSDVAAQNAMNNASYQRATFTAGTLASADFFKQQVPAIQAWRDYGNGVGGVPDDNVKYDNVDVPAEGRFIAAAKVRDNGNGTWTYDYAVFNHNSHRSGGSFSVPLPPNTTVTNIGFHDVDYHSGEVYSNTDWVVSQPAGAIMWSSPQTFAQNPNTNALRWGTMYNFWFTANRGPGDVQINLGLFRTGTPTSVTYTASGPIALCVEDIIGNAMVDIDDLVAVITAWGPCTHGGCPADVNGDNNVNIDDLTAVITAWGPCK